MSGATPPLPMSGSHARRGGRTSSAKRCGTPCTKSSPVRSASGRALARAADVGGASPCSPRPPRSAPALGSPRAHPVARADPAGAARAVPEAGIEIHDARTEERSSAPGRGGAEAERPVDLRPGSARSGVAWSATARTAALRGAADRSARHRAPRPRRVPAGARAAHNPGRARDRHGAASRRRVHARSAGALLARHPRDRLARRAAAGRAPRAHRTPRRPAPRRGAGVGDRYRRLSRGRPAMPLRWPRTPMWASTPRGPPGARSRPRRPRRIADPLHRRAAREPRGTPRGRP